MTTHQHSPTEGTENHERDQFHDSLDEMINLIHPLVRIGQATPLEASIESVGESLSLMPAGSDHRSNARGH